MNSSNTWGTPEREVMHHSSSAKHAPILNTVRLQPRDIVSLLDDINKQSASYRGADLRRGRRQRLAEHQPIVLEIWCPTNGNIRYRVVARNISPGGMAVLHGQYVHRDLQCIIYMTNLAGEWLRLNGHVVGCRHVRGALHEVSVRFTEAIDPKQFA